MTAAVTIVVVVVVKIKDDDDELLLQKSKLHELLEVIGSNCASIGSHGHSWQSLSLFIGMACSLSKIVALLPSLHLKNTAMTFEANGSIYDVLHFRVLICSKLVLDNGVSSLPMPSLVTTLKTFGECPK